MILRDQLNVPTRSELYNFVLSDWQAVTVLGVNAAGDIAAELWYLDLTSTAPDNGITVIHPLAIPPNNPGRYLLHIVQADWNALFNKPTIPASQVQCDWNQASAGAVDFVKNKPTLVSPVFFTLTTNASGMATVTYTFAYAVLPFLQSTMRTGSGSDPVLPTHTCLFSSQTVNGFSITMQKRNDLLGLLPSYQNVANATVDVVLMPR